MQGRLSADAWDCRAGSARCRMALGDIGGGLAAMRELRDDVVESTSHGSEAALTLRFQYAELLFAAGEIDLARQELFPLRVDVAMLRGAEDPLAQHVDELLRRLS